jgi:CRP-like cAMP-binding protein
MRRAGKADMDVYGLLSKTDFFSGMAPRSIRSLAEVCIPKSCEKRDLLFLEGQEAHSLFILAEGAVQLYKTSADGREVVIKDVLPGEIFAEVVLFEERHYPVSAVALQKSLIFMVPRVQFDCLLVTESFRRDFMAMLMKKQRYLTQRILYLTSHDVERRFFLFLRQQFGEKEEYQIQMGKRDIAASIGTIPETFSRLIQRLRERGVLEWHGKTLRLKEGFWDEAELEG